MIHFFQMSQNMQDTTVKTRHQDIDPRHRIPMSDMREEMEMTMVSRQLQHMISILDRHTQNCAKSQYFQVFLVPSNSDKDFVLKVTKSATEILSQLPR